MSAGFYHNCALKTDGTVVCWGSNAQGQATVPVGLASVVQIGAGQLHTCALKTDGTVVCWGLNNYGQATVPAGLASVAQVSAGDAHTCALKTDGTVVCWGNNAQGQATVPAGLSSVVQISTERYHTCALKTDGTVVCWGFNIYGQVTVPAGLASVAQISARLFHTCALKTDGTVVCWGLDYYGEASVPAGIASVVQISAGYFHNCALKTDQTVVCWGYNGSGQTAVPAGLVSVAQISAGGNHTCAVKTDGTVVCWGESGQGQATVPAGLNLNVRANQTITFGALSSRTFGDPPFALTASASSNLGVTFSASGTCAVAGSTVSLTGAGGCTITADQPGNASFFAAPSVSQSFAIARAPQVIAFGPLSPRVYGSPSLALSASGGASGNPVVFMSQTVATCTTSNGAVSIVAVGTCTITADQAGSANYLPAAQVTRSFVITPAPQTITITSSPPQPVLLDGSYTITATGGGSGSPIKVSSLTPGVCPVGANNVAAFIAVGACTIALDQAGAPNYLAAPQVTQSFNVLYAFTGFFSPVSNPPTLNVIDVGQSMPMWFSLAGDRGLAVLAAGSPTSQAITCPVGAVTNPISQVEDTGPGLQFKKASGRYVYLWRTDEAWAGTCRVFTLTLVDGTTHQASFKIRQQ